MSRRCRVCGSPLEWAGRGRPPVTCRRPGCRSLRVRAAQLHVSEVEALRRSLAKAEAALLRAVLEAEAKQAKVQALRAKVALVEDVAAGAP